MHANTKTLTPDLLQKMNAYWRAANYLSVGQIYLYDNPLLKRPLSLSDVKPLVVGHWGTTPGLSVIIDAIKESRRIFQRMNSYAIYRIAETQRVLFFMTL